MPRPDRPGRPPRAKKSLGQNFLVDSNAQRRIVDALDPSLADEVMEIGPGQGALTRHLARGLGPDIRVNAVAPGAVDSPWQIEWTEAQRAQSIENAPMGRRCTPEDIAEAILFLGCAGAMITDQTLTVDGGLLL